MGGKQSKSGENGGNNSKELDFSEELEFVMNEKRDEYMDDDDVEPAVKPTILSSKPKLNKKSVLCNAMGTMALTDIVIKGYPVKSLVRRVKRYKEHKDNQSIQLSIVQMVQLNDPHVAKCTGVFASPKEYFIALELNDRTVLDLLLSEKLSTKSKFKILWHIADGMAAIEDIPVYHGCLCASNCVVSDGSSSFKVGDWCSRGDMHSLWLAPETFSNDVQVLTSQSDSWSFGVLCAEVFGDGDLGVSNPHDDLFWQDKVKEEEFKVGLDGVEEGLRKSITMCFDEIGKRPDFSWLQAELHDLHDKWNEE
eukprot:m.80119 g.80119  ORF g.80119 m.80119 type:complete len:308 (-) comp12003_c1_seq3:297-1220(-)